MAEEKQNGEKRKGLQRVIVLAGVVLIASVAGFLAATMVGGGAEEAVAETVEPEEIEELPEDANGKDEYSYHEFPPVTVNLDEPRLARHVRAQPILAIKRDRFDAAVEKIEAKKLELNNWLTVYLAGCSLEEVRGSKNLNRIRREIREAFNEQLWPGRRPLIDHVLFKDFKVQ
jgi:flagellar basal body-associated protein FliL